MRVLSGKIRDRWGLARAAHAMACIAGRDTLRRITRLDEFLAFLDEVWIGSSERAAEMAYRGSRNKRLHLRHRQVTARLRSVT